MDGSAVFLVPTAIAYHEGEDKAVYMTTTTRLFITPLTNRGAQ